MSTGCAKRIFCLGYFRGTIKDENNLHKKFGSSRMRSEGKWFLPSQELIDYINDVNEEKDVFVEKNENGVMKYKTMSLLI